MSVPNIVLPILILSCALSIASFTPSLKKEGVNEAIDKAQDRLKWVKLYWTP